MKIYESAEDYLERILILKNKNGKVRSLDIANSMNYSKASISRAMKNLKENEYLTIDSLGYITLTKKGDEIAKRIYERHTMLSDFFISLGISEETAIYDACKVEHDLSEETFEAFKYYLTAHKKN